MAKTIQAKSSPAAPKGTPKVGAGPGTACSGECGCSVQASRGSGAPGAGTGPGAHAAGVDAALKATNLKHLRRIEGQVRGIAAMIEDDRYCADIITQVSAVRESLHSVARNLMRNHLKHCAVQALHGDEKSRDAVIAELLDLVAKVAR